MTDSPRTTTNPVMLHQAIARVTFGDPIVLTVMQDGTTNILPTGAHDTAPMVLDPAQAQRFRAFLHMDHEEAGQIVADCFMEDYKHHWYLVIPPASIMLTCAALGIAVGALFF